MRFAHQKDGNHADVVRCLEAHGCFVLDVSDHRKIGVDLIVFRRGGVCAVEVKDGSKPPSARELTPSEVRFRDRCRANGFPWALVETTEQARELAHKLVGEKV